MLESLYKENKVIESEMKIISSGAKWEVKQRKDEEYVSLCKKI